jgi:hypothetical protein
MSREYEDGAVPLHHPLSRTPRRALGPAVSISVLRELHLYRQETSCQRFAIKLVLAHRRLGFDLLNVHIGIDFDICG